MSHLDILEELNLTVVSHQIEMRALLQPEDETESLVLDQVTHEPIHIDDIGRQVHLPIPCGKQYVKHDGAQRADQAGGWHASRPCPGGSSRIW